MALESYQQQVFQFMTPCPGVFSFCNWIKNVLMFCQIVTIISGFLYLFWNLNTQCCIIFEKVSLSFGSPVSSSLMFSVDYLISPFFFLMLIWKFDGIISINNPLNVIFKTVKSIRSVTSSHFSKTCSTKQNLRFTKLAEDFCSFIIFVI